MNNYKFSTSACRYCRFFSPEGRRGGMCSKLNVLVKAHWKSCQVASPVFADDWTQMPEIAMLEKSFVLGCNTPSPSFEAESLPKKGYHDQEEIASS